MIPLLMEVISVRAWLVTCGEFLTLCGVLVVSLSAIGQATSQIHGTVLTKDGRPLAGAYVLGSEWKNCCPVQYDHMTTGAEGEFTLAHRVPVIHFTRDGFQPLTVIVASGSNELHVTMEPATDGLVLRPCGPPKPGERKIGSGEYGLQFAVAKHAVKILGGKPDTDYVRYVVKPKKSQSSLELWFGPYAMSSEPEEEQFEKSANFVQRSLVLPNGGAIGMDSWGQLPDGTHWRQMAMLGSGARYTDVAAEDAKLFDEIINSACFTPYSSH
ncbi:MAG: carboxypeptidase-like regulatory domain-containing protein [Candidatus Acidiferrales bacterium]